MRIRTYVVFSSNGDDDEDDDNEDDDNDDDYNDGENQIYIDDDKVYHQSIVGWGDSNDHRPEKEQFCLNPLCHGD